MIQTSSWHMRRTSIRSSWWHPRLCTDLLMARPLAWWVTFLPLETLPSTFLSLHPPSFSPFLPSSILHFSYFSPKIWKKNCLSISHSISVHNIWRWEVNKCIIVIHLVKACTQIYYIIHGDVEMLKRRHSEWDRIYIVQNGILHKLNYSDVVNHTLFFSLSSFPKCSCKN